MVLHCLPWQALQVGGTGRVLLRDLLGVGAVPVPEAEARAGRVVALEVRIARAHATRTDTGDVQKGNNPWTRAELESRAPGMDWGAFLHAAVLAAWGLAGFAIALRLFRRRLLA